MSSSFKKMLPVLAILIVFAGGYLISELDPGMFGGAVQVESVAAQAQEVQMQLNVLTTITGLTKVVRSERLSSYIPITKNPPVESVGRDNPFMQ